jgi:peptide/nickel transport system permease protein
LTEQTPRSPLREDPTYSEIVWTQFRKRWLPYGSLLGVVGLLFLAIYAPLLASNKPFLWKVEGAGWESPWLKALYDRNFYESSVDLFFNTLLFPGTLLALPVLWIWVRSLALPRKSRARIRRRALGISTALWLLTLIFMLVSPSQAPKKVYPRMQEQLESQGQRVTAIYPPLPYSFRDFELDEVRQGISRAHLLGTDNSGRDVLTRLIFGTRISLTVGVFAVMIYIVIGTIIGAIAGYYGGRVDAVILRIIEVFLSIPSLFLILTLAAFIEKRSIFHIMAIIAFVRWTTPARLVRAEFLRLRNLDFVTAARAAGFTERAIIFKHVLPNAIGPVLVSATFGVAAAILIESTMSFLGLGDITVPSWGQILSTGRTTGMWTLILAPGFAIFWTVSLLNLVGEGFRDALDPKLRT